MQRTLENKIFDNLPLRLWLFQLAVWIAFAGLLVALWSIQLRQGEKFELAGEQQSLRRVCIPALRGIISDRNGIHLAENLPSYSLVIYLEEIAISTKKRKFFVKEVMNAISNLSARLNFPINVSERQIADHIATKKPLPFTVCSRVSMELMGRFAEVSEEFPFAELTYEPERFYPKQKLAAHILGYVKKGGVYERKGDKFSGDLLIDGDNPEEAEELYHYYLPDMIGMSGIEKSYDGWLAGKPGGRLMRVNVSGFKHEDLGFKKGENGGELILAIDSRIQASVEKALQDVVGAAVVVDVNNGDILAMASSPAFNPNDFYPAIPIKIWQEIEKNEDAPLINRAISAAYPPGSTFKPLVALAAIEEGKASIQTIFDCPGYFFLGNHKFACYMNTAHGKVNMLEAIKHSCNVYFYQLGLLAGYPAILNMAAIFGLGKPTGTELPAETAGFLPSREWKRSKVKDDWRDGDTCNLSVGQGYLLVTPLQMALVAAAIANGGKLFKPRLVLAKKKSDEDDYRIIPPVLVRNIPVKDRTLNEIKKGMLMVVEEADGTGRYAKMPDVLMAGKTGTAEYGKKGSGLKYGWMILFAPYDKPKYAVAMVVERAVSGGSTVAPRLKLIMQDVFGSHYDKEEG